MAILPILRFPDPRLRAVAEPVKRFGGEVHSVGIMLLLLVPLARSAALAVRAGESAVAAWALVGAFGFAELLTAMKQRQDVVTDGEIAAKIVANAPAADDDYFMVPKVIE